MYEKISIGDKNPEVKSRNPVPQIRRKTETFQSMNSPVDRILFLQRTIGNQAVGKLIKSGALQAKLRIGQPGDIYEQEADRVAEQVMRMPAPVQRKCPECEDEVRRQPEKEKEEEETLQMKKIASGSTPDVTQELESRISAIRGGGQPLPESMRAFFEPRFGHDFSQVRVHKDAKAAEAARAVNAKAYTVGRDVVFGAGQYVPETSEGRKLMAHELTHVVQQGATGIVRRQPEPEKIETYTVKKGDTLGSIARMYKTKVDDLKRLNGLESDLIKAGKVLKVPALEIKATPKRAPLTFEKVKSLVAGNNKSTKVSNELIICLIWKESGFDPNVKNPKSSATGLMQITKSAVTDVNKNSPKGVHFEHSEMTDPNKNIQCGTLYLDLRIKWAGDNITAGLNAFGTGSGYAANILTCEECLKKEPEGPYTCMHKIHR